MITNIPEDINVEVLLSYLKEGTCKVVYKGLHKRNAYNDIVDFEEKKDGNYIVGISRHSLYDSLPEYLFHPIERFGSLGKKEDQKKFSEEYELQEQEREKAYLFFAPLDLFLLNIRLEVRKKLSEYTESNKVLIDILSDNLTEDQKNNRFIKQAIPFLPSCKTIRGDKTLITLMLRKIFMEEGLLLEVYKKNGTHTDPEPRYNDSIGSSLDALYVGNTYEQPITKYIIHYWSDEYCDDNFLQFISEVEALRSFIQDFFMSVEEELNFDISTDSAPLRLSDNLFFNYLNYNTNI